MTQWPPFLFLNLCNKFDIKIKEFSHLARILKYPCSEKMIYVLEKQLSALNVKKKKKKQKKQRIIAELKYI